MKSTFALNIVKRCFKHICVFSKYSHRTRSPFHIMEVYATPTIGILHHVLAFSSMFDVLFYIVLAS